MPRVRKKFNHAFDFAFDFAFEVVSKRDDASDVTPVMMIAALRKRIDAIEAEDGGAEMLHACNCFDTMEEET